MDKIFDYANKNVSDLLKEFIDKKKRDKKLVFYPGKVVDNKDPDKLGKCKIRVYSVYSGIPDEDLPWAIPDFNFIGSSLGSFIVPTVDSIVKVYFEDDEFYQPKYTTKVLDSSKLTDFSGDIYEDYPDSMIFFETESGDYFKINRKTNVTTYQSSVGVLVRIEANGNTTIDTSNAEVGDITLKSPGNISIEAGKDLTIQGKTINLKAPGLSLWKPNILQQDLFSGVPHSLDGVGITTLKGSEPI